MKKRNPPLEPRPQPPALLATGRESLASGLVWEALPERCRAFSACVSEINISGVNYTYIHTCT